MSTSICPRVRARFSHLLRLILDVCGQKCDGRWIVGFCKSKYTAVLVYLKSILRGRAERGIRMIKIQLFKKCCFVGPSFLLAVGIENQRIGTRMIWSVLCYNSPLCYKTLFAHILNYTITHQEIWNLMTTQFKLKISFFYFFLDSLFLNLRVLYTPGCTQNSTFT